MSRIFVFATLLACVAAVPLRAISESAEEKALFAAFKRQYNKVYLDAHDESYREAIFVQNLRMVRAHNEENQHSYTLAMNKFGDMPVEEFHAKHTGFNGLRHRYIRSQNIADLSHVEVPSEIDWQAKGAVTPVKDQADCGSCWAFSTTGAIEGAWFVAKGKLVSLSEQQLMDCSGSEGNGSCEGGWMDSAFEYAISNKGICSEASYPYDATDHITCQSCANVATISKYSDVAPSESALQQAVAQQPVAIAIDPTALQFYSSGVLTYTCGNYFGHAMLAVGYGTLNGVAYWKVKNSWGTSWGEQGYVLIGRGADDCCIHDAASFPVV